MAEMLTTLEAASILGVSRARVLILIGRGKLAATWHADHKRGHWLLDRAEVERRRDAPKSTGGRPPTIVR